MTMNLGKTLAIAAGIGAVGVGGYLLFKGKGGEEADATQDPAAAGGSLTGPPTGTTMAPGAGPTGPAGMVPTAGSGIGPGDMTATGTTSAGQGMAPGQGQLQGEQVGPYTVVPDPQSGLQIVFETATQQPVGVVDAQGNITPITIDANGNLQLAQDPSTASALGTPAGPATHPGVAATTGSPVGDVGAGQADRGAVYQQIAMDLFANASDPMVGAASSDAMAGVANVAPDPGVQAGAVGASGPAVPTTGAAPATGMTPTAPAMAGAAVPSYQGY